MSSDALARFRRAVLGDPDLQKELRADRRRDRFVALVVEHAQARGFDVEPDDVEQGLQESRRAWLEHWI